MNPDLKTIVRDGNEAKFSHYRDGNFFYVVKVQDRKFSNPHRGCQGYDVFRRIQGNHSDTLDSEGN